MSSSNAKYQKPVCVVKKKTRSWILPWSAVFLTCSTMLFLSTRLPKIYFSNQNFSCCFKNRASKMPKYKSYQCVQFACSLLSFDYAKVMRVYVLTFPARLAMVDKDCKSCVTATTVMVSPLFSVEMLSSLSFLLWCCNQQQNGSQPIAELLQY